MWSAKASPTSWHDALPGLTHIVWHLQVECGDEFQFQILAGVDNAAGSRIAVRVNKLSHDGHRRVCANVQDKGRKVGHIEAWPSVELVSSYNRTMMTSAKELKDE